MRFASGFCLAAAVLLLAACSGSSAQVDFSRHEQPAAPTVTTSTSAGVLRLAVASVISPLPTSDLYQQLADYLGDKLDRPVELVQGKTYAEINDLVKSGDVTLPRRPPRRQLRFQVAGSSPAAPATDIAVLEGGRGLGSGFWFGAHPWRLKPLLLGQHIREGLGRNRLAEQESLD